MSINAVYQSLYYNQSAQSKENAEKLRLENIEKFNIEAMDRVIHGYLDKYVPEFAVEKKIVLPKLKKLDVKKEV